MLSPLDDYPVHQISEPMRHVGTSDRNFYDRYYFNIHGTGDVHGTDEELFCVIGVGQYPNLSVADAFVSVSWATTTGWSGRPRPSAPTGWTPRSGPIRVEVLKGLEQVRVILEPNEWGIELDAVYDGFCEAHLEARHFDRQFSRVTFDSTRFAQVGGWTGTLKVGDREIAAHPGPVVGLARPLVGHPPGRRVRAPGHPGHRHRRSASSGSTRRCGSTTTPWSPSSRSAPSGERIMQDAHRVFPRRLGPRGRVAGPARARAALRARAPAR